MRTSKPRLHPRGFTLVEIAVVLFIIAIVIAMAAAITRGVTAAQKRSLTATRMAGVEAAIANFVAQQRRLPCPANGTRIAGTHADAGTEMGGGAVACSAGQANGVVPWRALGLTEVEITDGWDRRLTYRVFPGLALSNGMDMSKCDPAGEEPPLVPNPLAPSACNVNCLSTNLGLCTKPLNFLTGRGIEIRDLNGTALMLPASGTGAAYVVISHGESGGGGYLSSGVKGVSTVDDGDEEEKNYADIAYGAHPYYVDNSLVDVGGPGHFDDIVSRPSVSSVISKAGLGPRAH